MRFDYQNIKNIKASIEEYSDRVVEAGKDEVIKKFVKKFNASRDARPNIPDLILKLSDHLSNV